MVILLVPYLLEQTIAVTMISKLLPVILALCLGTVGALTANPCADVSRRSVLVTSSFAFFGLPAVAEDVDDLSMPAATEQSEVSC